MELKTQSNCRRCCGRGVILEEGPEGLVSRICSCQRERLVGRRLQAAGIAQPRYQGMLLSSYQPRNRHQQKALSGIIDYVNNFSEIRGQKNNSVLLVGDVGVGKTHLLVGAARALIEKGFSVLFVSTVELIENLREAELNKTNPEYDGESLRSQMHLLSTAELVIFDDVGQEKITEWVQVQYYRIINQRYLAMLPTMFSTNLGREELKKAVGDTVASRIAEMSAGRLYVIQGENLRYEYARRFPLNPAVWEEKSEY